MEEANQLTLLVVGFDGQDTAKKAIKKLKKLQRADVIDLHDAVGVYKTKRGRVKLIQGRSLTAKKGALGVGSLGLVAGALLGGPIGGALVGALIGGTAGAVADKDSFSNENLKEIGELLEDGESALFLLVKDVDMDKFRTEMAVYSAKMNSFLLAEDDLVAIGDIANDELFVAMIEDDVEVVEDDDDDDDDDKKSD